MLSLLEFLGDSAEVQSKLSEMQRGFRGFLVDRDGNPSFMDHERESLYASDD